MPSRHKVSFTQSPLAFPTSPIHRLASRLQDYLHFPNPYPLYVMIAALVGNYAQGRPIWLMLIGPPSCGKSELLNSLLSLARIIEGGAITGVGALLSASGKRDRAEDATGGLLREIGPRGALVIKEFTSILSLPAEAMRQLMAALREIYDGRWTRPVGTDGARSLHWEGKMALLTGCTQAIDRHRAMSAEMGERFLSYRFDLSDGWSESYKALDIANSEELTLRLQACIVDFAEDLGLDWDAPPELPELDSHARQRVIAFAQFAALGRSAVIRDPYTHEVIDVSVGEYPTRLALTLAQILRSLLFIGVNQPDSWRIIRKLAFDSLPSVRHVVLLALLSGQSRLSSIAKHIRVSETSVRHSLEELEIHSLVERTGADWELSGWSRRKLAEAMNGMPMSNGNGNGAKPTPIKPE